MNVTITFDVSLARLVHLDWLVRVEDALNKGQGKAPSAIQYYRDCDLGVWLHGEARRRYRDCADIKRLTVEHRRFHHAVEHAVIALHDGQPQKAQEYLGTARHISKDIIYLLTLVELRNLESKNNSTLVSKLFAAVDSFLDARARWLKPPVNKDASVSLDITYARLAHLHWATELDRCFRNFGKGVALQSHNSCEFGTWIRLVGHKKYGYLPEIALLDQAHQEFHEAALRIIRCLQDRHVQRADEAYADVQNLSREIAYYLTLVEFQLGDELRKETSLGAPNRKIFDPSCGCGPNCSDEKPS